MYHRSIKGATTHRHYHEEDYDDGSVCAVTGQKRRLKMFYFCDEYAAYQGLDKEKTDPLNGLAAWEEEAIVK